MREVVAPVTPAFVSVPVSEKASAIARHGGVAPTRFERFSNDEYFTLDANRLIPALLSKVRIVGLALGKWRALLKERGAFHGQAAATVREGI
jgi:hypothetical protein